MKRKVALVTGSSRGIGRGIVVQLAKEGVNIALNGRSYGDNAKKSVELCRAEGVEAKFFQGDISNSSSRKNLIEEIRRSYGKLHILVNNAGVAPKERNDILETDEKSFDRVLNVNLKGSYFLTQLVSKWMIEQKETNPDLELVIINISSISAYASSPNRGAYCLSKAGISMMTKLYADRLSEYGINVYEIRPGIIRTSMTEPVQDKYDKLIEQGITPIKRWGQPEDVGKAVVGIVKGLYPFSTGEVINVDGGFHLRRL